MVQSLSVYWGGFLATPIPLELSLNYCSHDCAFCYANLNSLKRTADVPQIMGLLSGYRDRTSYAAKLLQLGYPIMCSTHVDFFAKSNEDLAIALLDIMLEADVKFTFCTRGGDRYIETIKRLPPTAIYFSFVTLDDDIARRVEPNSPLPSDRLKMIAQSIEHGHRVVAGINPTVPDWLGDPLPLLAELSNIGVEGILSQSIHLNNRQIENMSDRQIAALGERVLKRGKMRDRDKEMFALVERVGDTAQELEMEIFAIGQGGYSKYWKPYQDTYPVLFPTTQDFINHCWDTGKDVGDIITWEEYRDFFVPRLPQGVFELRNHFSATQNHKWSSVWNEKIAQKMTYEKLLWWAWQLNDLACCPVNASAFRWAGTRTKEGWVKYADDNDMPYLVFTPFEEDNLIMIETDELVAC